jgi:ribosomal protein L28
LTTDVPEETACEFYGATANGLLVVLASYNGGGSGTFYSLHIVDVAAAAGIDIEGKRYQRINLTNIRTVILGDRWQGELKISGSAVRVITTRTDRPTTARDRRLRSSPSGLDRARVLSNATHRSALPSPEGAGSGASTSSASSAT